MDTKETLQGVSGTLFPRFLEEAGVVTDPELLKRLHISSEAYMPVIRELPSVRNLSALISLDSLELDEKALDVVIAIFDEVRYKAEVLSPLAYYLANDFQRIDSYINGFITGNIVSIAMSAWGSAPQRLKSLMTIQLKALFTSLASAEEGLEEHIKTISQGAFHLIDNFLTHSELRRDYIDFLKVLGKYLKGKVGVHEMREALVSTVQTFKEELLKMTHFTGAAKRVSEIALPRLNLSEQ